MKKFTFLIILLLIIFYGIFSNYKSKIDRNASNFVNSRKDSNTKREFGCNNDGGIISSSYCRFSENNCRKYFLSEYFGYLNNEEIVHCTSYKVGVDEEGYDIIMEIISDKEKINPKFANIEKNKIRPSEISGFMFGEGLCNKPKDKFDKTGIRSDSLRNFICSLKENNNEVLVNRLQINEKKIYVFFYFDEGIIWINSSSF